MDKVETGRDAGHRRGEKECGWIRRCFVGYMKDKLTVKKTTAVCR